MLIKKRMKNIAIIYVKSIIIVKSDTKDQSLKLLLVALIGLILGYYFGSKIINYYRSDWYLYIVT